MPNLVLSLFFIGATSALAAVDFVHQIAPILKKHCLECHAGQRQKGGLSMETRADILRGGESGPAASSASAHTSLILQRVSSTDLDERMPPKGPALSQPQILLLRSWIDEGMPWPDGFTFSKPRYQVPLFPRTPALPAATSPQRQHPIDRIIDAYLAKQSLATPQPISDSTFLRRVCMDLNGLLPTTQQQEMLQQHPGAAGRVKLIESLLEDDLNYTEHWLSFWNDLLRNDYGGTGFITGGRRQISSWLYHALRSNKPFDQMVRELIAPADKQSSGFIEGIAWRGDVSAGQTVEIQFAQSVGQAFLGINLKCASCHDSFIDSWKLDQAYGLAAIYSHRPLEIARCDKPTGRMAKASFLFPELGEVDASQPQPERLQQLAKLMTHPKNGRLRRTLVNRIWHRLMGRGLVHPLDSMEGKPWSEDLLDHLANEFANHGHDLRHLIAHIASSQAYQSQSEILTQAPDESRYLYRGPRSKRLSAEQFIDAIWQLTQSAPSQMDAPVLRVENGASALPPHQPEGSWIWVASSQGQAPPAGQTVVLRRQFKLDQQPGFASAWTVADNRVEFFVNGRSVGGSNDWNRPAVIPLHTHLKAGNNSLVIVAQNEGSGPNAAGAYLEMVVQAPSGAKTKIKTDSGWEGLEHRPVNKEGRLGALPAKGWKPASVVKALPVWQRALAQHSSSWQLAAAGQSPRPIRASLLKADFLMRSLGRPNRDQIVSSRPDDLTTLEAMDLANAASLSETLQRGASQLLQKHRWSNLTSAASWLFQAALAREPEPAELQTLVNNQAPSPNAQSIADLLWAILMLPEFQRVF